MLVPAGAWNHHPAPLPPGVLAIDHTCNPCPESWLPFAHAWPDAMVCQLSPNEIALFTFP
jgi:hypothetical protein